MLRSHARGVSLAALNLTQHLAAAGSGDDGVRYALPAASRNDGLLRAKAEAAAAAAAAARRRGGAATSEGRRLKSTTVAADDNAGPA